MPKVTVLCCKSFIICWNPIRLIMVGEYPIILNAWMCGSDANIMEYIPCRVSTPWAFPSCHPNSWNRMTDRLRLWKSRHERACIMPQSYSVTETIRPICSICFPGIPISRIRVRMRFRLPGCILRLCAPIWFRCTTGIRKICRQPIVMSEHCPVRVIHSRLIMSL